MSKKVIGREERLVTIGEAAKILGVSIATVRRWNNDGTLKATRKGRYRYFAVSDLEKVKFEKPISISEAAKLAGVSVDTMRRLEKRGVIKPERSESGERLYTKKVLDNFLSSEYFVSRKKKEKEVLKPFRRKTGEQKAKEKVLDVIVSDHDTKIDKLRSSLKVPLRVGVSVVSGLVIVTTLLTILFLTLPEQTSKMLGYYQVPPSALHPEEDEDHQTNVLGVQDESIIEEEEHIHIAADRDTNVAGTLLKPFSRLALSAVRTISKDIYYKAVPSGTIDDVDANSLSVLGNVEIAGNIYLGGVIWHDSPVLVRESMSFIDQEGLELFDIGIHGQGLHEQPDIPSALQGSLVFTSKQKQNEFFMEVTFWDSILDMPTLILNQGGYSRASTFNRSVQVGKSLGSAAVDGSYTKFEGFSFIDGDTSATGADLGVEDDIEAKGSIYSQEDIIAEGKIGIGLAVGGIPLTALEVNSNLANSVAILELGNTAGDIQLFRTDATPESAITGSIGDLAIDSTNGSIYLKAAGSSNTGWINIGTSDILTDVDGDTLIQVEESSDENVIRFDLGGSSAIENALILDQSNGFYWNSGNNNLDFRIDGDNNDNVFFVDASADMVGIGNNSPSTTLHVDSNVANTTAILTIENTAGDLQFFRTDATPELSVTGSIGDLVVDSTSGKVYIKETGSSTNTGWIELAAGTINVTDITLADNSTDAFLVREGTNDYIDIDTNDSSETVTLGNTTTNPIFSFLGSFFGFNSNSGNTTAVLGVENTGGDFQIFRVDATPESAVTGSIGDLAVDSTNGDVYIKKTGNSTNTGWTQITTGADSGKYAGKTSSTYDGTITSGAKVSYDAVNTICGTEYTGSHICSTDEILSTIATENFSSYSADGDVWIAEGPPGFTASANDCNAWTANDADNLGPFWSWNANIGGGRGRLTPCTSTLPVACCK